MYVPLVAALLEADVEVTYISHVTGHGLLKLMRPAKPLSYRIERLPEVPPVLSFLVEQAGMDAQAAYSTFNMGSGYALYCAAGAGETIVRIARAPGPQRTARRARGGRAQAGRPRARRRALRRGPARAVRPEA